MTAPGDHDQPPGLVFAAGNPSPEEIAAVVTVLSARLARADRAGAGETARSGWSARSRMLRTPTARSPGGWRASALPR
jgi:acyl-CoA carboxylase epsilon subunit